MLASCTFPRGFPAGDEDLKRGKGTVDRDTYCYYH